MPISLGYLGFTVTDLDAWRSFAADVIGLMPVDSGDPHVARFRMDDRAFRLSLHRGDADGLAYAGFDAGSAEGLADLVARLEADGVATKPLDGALEARRAAEVVCLEDPAGNPVEVFHTPVLDHRPMASPAGTSGFVTGAGGMGHLVMLTSPFDETLRFYKELFGFRTSDIMRMGPARVEFLHCNQRHHTLALGDAAGMNMLIHFMVEMACLDDVGYALDRCRDRGLEITMGLGRHANDYMTSFYVRTPSGFEVEIGSGGRLVDDATWTVSEIDGPSLWGHRPEGGAA